MNKLILIITVLCFVAPVSVFAETSKDNYADLMIEIALEKNAEKKLDGAKRKGVRSALGSL